MKIKVFVFGTNDSDEKKLFDDMLRETFAGHTDKEEAIEYYTSIKDASGSISKAFSDSQTVMFFAEQNSYCALKKVIARAFGFRLEKNEAVFEKALRFASDSVKKDELFEDTHALLPLKAKVFIPSDGLFSGFASVRGQQSVIFLPYSVQRASSLLAGHVIPFINSVYGLSIPTEFAEHIYARQLLDVLQYDRVSIALAQTKTADLFCDYISDSEVLRDCISRTPKSEERGNMRPAEYVVNLSIAAAELQGVPYGIVLSNAFYMDESSRDRLTVFMAVTNDKKTTVREIKSFAWESSSEFMQRCCGELCSLLSEIITRDRRGDEDLTPEESKKIQKYRNLIAIVMAAIILLCIAGGYIFSSHSYSLQDWMKNHFPAVFGQQLITDEEMQTDDPSAENTLPSEISGAEASVNAALPENTGAASEPTASAEQTTAENGTSQTETFDAEQDTAVLSVG